MKLPEASHRLIAPQVFLPSDGSAFVSTCTGSMSSNMQSNERSSERSGNNHAEENTLSGISIQLQQYLTMSI